MNDPNRKIDIDKSSLLSLKAELLRKQEEVSRAKAFNSIDDFVPKKVPKPEKPPPSSRTSTKHKDAQQIELEDSAELIRSKKILESKAKYYDRMVASGGALNSDENCLVMFNYKKQTDKPAPNPEERQYSSSDDSELSSGEDEPSRKPRSDTAPAAGDWVEYTDFLGRSRKCRRKDLEECLRRDKDMARDAKGHVDDKEEEDEDEEEGELIGPVPSMAITEDTIGERFREMREQWAKQQAENLDKDSVHYQDVLFDEARQHGVGYYAFSTDREERNRQQQELDSIRDATLEAQKEREDLRKARDKIIADRMKAAKARQRARQGLPPEEEKEEPSAEPEKEPQQSEATEDALYDTSEEKKRLKAEAKAQRKKEKEERKRNRERQKHVRPWDEGKQKDDEMDWKPAREWHVMSQEEWNEMKRKERIDEFAPPVDYTSKTERRRNNPSQPTGYYEDKIGRRDEQEDGGNGGNDSEEDEDEQIGPLSTDRCYNRAHSTANNPLLPSSVFYGGGGAIDEDVVSMPTIPGTEDDIILPEETNRTLFFTTKKTKKEFKRRNYDASLDDAGSEKRPKPQPVPIRNELSEGESGDERESCRRGHGEGAEIAPPATFEYYGPTSSAARQNQRKAPPVSKNALEASIEAGLRFLREQSDKGGPSTGTKNKWTSNADY